MEPDVLNRLGPVAARQTLTLTHCGRKTGKLYEVTIWFVLGGDRFYIGTANVKRQWVRNVQKTPQIKLSIGGEKFEGTARFLTDHNEHERAMAAISAEVLDICADRGTGADSHRHQSDARQHWIV